MQNNHKTRKQSMYVNDAHQRMSSRTFCNGGNDLYLCYSIWESPGNMAMNTCDG